jgi:hypothetical protein
MSEYRNLHEREAARLRLLIANATTPRVKARLSEEIEKLDQLAEGVRRSGRTLATLASSAAPRLTALTAWWLLATAYAARR